MFPIWVPEFYGDVVMVNGKAWPNMNVERNLYRVRILNVCNSRIMTVAFVVEGTEEYIPFKLYKADVSYYEEPLELTQVELPVSGRVEIVMDFALVGAKRLIMKNVEVFGKRHHHHSNLQKHDNTDSTSIIMSFTPTVAAPKIHLPAVSFLNPHLS